LYVVVDGKFLWAGVYEYGKVGFKAKAGVSYNVQVKNWGGKLAFDKFTLSAYGAKSVGVFE